MCYLYRKLSWYRAALVATMVSQRNPKLHEVRKIFELDFYCDRVYVGFLQITNVLRKIFSKYKTEHFVIANKNTY